MGRINVTIATMRPDGRREVAAARAAGHTWTILARRAASISGVISAGPP
jgi:hypothetical protein